MQFLILTGFSQSSSAVYTFNLAGITSDNMSIKNTLKSN